MLINERRGHQFGHERTFSALTAAPPSTIISRLNPCHVCVYSDLTTPLLCAIPVEWATDPTTGLRSGRPRQGFKRAAHALDVRRDRRRRRIG